MCYCGNSDNATSDGLMMAKDIDVSSTRTLGALTKLDIINAGADAKKVLLNEEIHEIQCANLFWGDNKKLRFKDNIQLIYFNSFFEIKRVFYFN